MEAMQRVRLSTWAIDDMGGLERGGWTRRRNLRTSIAPGTRASAATPIFGAETPSPLIAAPAMPRSSYPSSSAAGVLLSLLALFCTAPAGTARAQAAPPYTVELVETTFVGAPGLHSFALGRHGGRWLLVGGRTNGLHGFVYNPFPPAFANGALVVLDPEARRAWAASLDALPDAVRDPLRATNAQYVQEGGTLYVVGGYGDETPTGVFRTFPTLTALDVRGVIEAVVAGRDVAPFIRQIEDERLAVTGGDLERVGDRYHLVFGHRFDGYYRRGGEGTTFTQAYTDAIRSFRIDDDGAALRVSDFATVADTAHFHRRDLTVAPVVAPDGTPGYAAYGGVFRRDADLPFLRPVYVTGDDYAVDGYEQQMSHYTCPALPFFDAATGTMYTTFFGGIGLYYQDDATGALVRDDEMPFIDEITTLTRHADGSAHETIHGVRMPGLLGSNAVFVPAEDVAAYPNGVLRLDALSGRTRVGHLYGGIEAARPNRGHTVASRRLFEVYVTPSPTPTTSERPPEGAFRLEGPYPHPAHRAATLSLTLAHPEHVAVEVFDLAGRRVARLHDGRLAAGLRHTFDVRAEGLPGGVYVVRVRGERTAAARRLVLLP